MHLEDSNTPLNTGLDTKQLLVLANTTMPFGKYSGRHLINLPEAYLVWFSEKGFPDGQLGTLLQLVLVIKTNGLEHLIYPLIKK